MNPLEKLIGLAPVDEGADRLYVNRIPNVNPELIEAIAESDEKSDEDPTGLRTVWQEVKDEAYDKLTADLLSEMAKRANFREVVQTSELPDHVTDTETISFDTDRMIGVNITLPKSRYQSLFIRSLYVAFNNDSAPETFIIRIYDGDKGKQIGDDILTTTGEDPFEFPVNITVDCSRSGNKSVFVGILLPAGTELISMGWNTDCMYTVNDLLSFDPDAVPLMSEVDETSECFVALDYEIRLSVDKVAGLYGDRLKRSYALLCAIGFIERGLKSKKASKWTLVNRDSEKQNVIDLKDDLKKELAGACRQIYAQVDQERLALVSRPDDQAGYYIGSYV